MSSYDIEETRRYYRLQQEIKKLREIEEDLKKITDVDLPALIERQRLLDVEKSSVKKPLYFRFKEWLKTIF